MEQVKQGARVNLVRKTCECGVGTKRFMNTYIYIATYDSFECLFVNEGLSYRGIIVRNELHHHRMLKGLIIKDG